MKIRRMKRKKLAHFRRHRAFLWSTQKLVELIAKDYAKAIEQIRESYLK